jgi:hypothetical protein
MKESERYPTVISILKSQSKKIKFEVKDVLLLGHALGPSYELARHALARLQSAGEEKNKRSVWVLPRSDGTCVHPRHCVAAALHELPRAR